METSTTCANCGKGEEESNNLKSCAACKLVKYCNRECQIAHRPQHKRECKKRAAELYDEKLFKEVEPDECPICLLPMPISSDDTTIESCCGKRICNGCVYAMNMSEGGADLCAFCRTPTQSSDEEEIERTKNLMDKGNAEAFLLLAGYYAHGSRGLVQDWAKARELTQKAGELGCAGGYYNLASLYSNGTGIEVDKKKAKHYFELAAIGGDITARHSLGCEESLAGNEGRAFKHFTLAAKAGHEKALDVIKQLFTFGAVAKDDYESTLRAHQARQDEMKSDARDKARVSTGIFMR